jgi:predicted HAD superfamily Cof-like phosphohydrolase
MSNGADVADKSNKMTAIKQKVNFLFEASKKSLNFSSEIRAKLLASDPAAKETDEKQPREGGQLNDLINDLQDILNLINASNAHLVSINKEI